MVTLTTPHGTFTADDEAGAMKAARKAKAEARRLDKLHEEYRTHAQHQANWNALRLFKWFHESRRPDSMESLEVGTTKSCAIPQDDGTVKLYCGDHVGVWRDRGFSIMRCVEMPSGVIAIAVLNRHTDTHHFIAIGCHEGIVAFVELPECVGKWAAYPG